MKPEHFIYKSDGLYYMQNVPDRPVLSCGVEATESNCPLEYCRCYKKTIAYNEALERAKAEAVKCDNVLQEKAESKIPNGKCCVNSNVCQELGRCMREGKIYTINMEEKIEVYQGDTTTCTSCTQDCYTFREPCKNKFARIAAPKKQEESGLTQDELNALSSVGIIAKNWYAVSYSKNQMPFAIFESIEYANLYRDKFSATSIVEPWPMVIKDLRKK